MDPISNPFVPGAGVAPQELSGREDQIEYARIGLERVMAGRFAKSAVAVGLRGVGKTVLLNRIKQLAQDRDYGIAAVEVGDHGTLAKLLLPHMRRLMLEFDRIGAVNAQVKRGLRILKGFVAGMKISYGDMDIELGVDPEPGVADSGDLQFDFPDVLASLGRAAQARGRQVVLLIDEIQYLSSRDMSALIMSLHRVSQDRLPVILFAAGLPQVIGLTGKSKSYAERLLDFLVVDALPYAAMKRALTYPASLGSVAFEDDAVAAIFHQTRGYPYFVQVYGYECWNVSPASPIQARDVDRAMRTVLLRLDASFFRVRFDRLTPREKDYLRAMAQLGEGPHRSGDIADTLGLDVRTTGPLRSGLIGKGMIYSPAHGETAFSVPLFDQFLHRLMPVWSPLPRTAKVKKG